MKSLAYSFTLICVFAGGFFYFFSSDREEVVEQYDDVPLLKLESFEFYKYNDSQLVEVFSADHGSFYQPNRAEFSKQVSGRRLMNGGIEALNAEHVSAYFESRTLKELLNAQSELSHAQARDNVRIYLGEDILITNKVDYNAKEERLTSNQPLKLLGESRKMNGDKGFQYSHKTGSLEVYGPVNGVVESLESR